MKTRRYRDARPTSPPPRVAEHYLRANPRRPIMGEAGPPYLLRTLGHPVLARRGGAVVPLRRKDLALLAYLCVEAPRVHARGRLAALLWGESDEARARHSLTQALGRIQRATERAALVVERETVRAAGGVASDADLLLGRTGETDELLTAYEGPFLEGFEAGFGSEEFDEWAARRRAELRNLALRWLDRRGDEAEAAGEWTRALHLGERAVRIDPVWERGHRRVMRALAELGDHNHALRHYAEFRQWLSEEVGADPDPDTRALAARIRTAPSKPPPPCEPSPAPEPEPPPVHPPTSPFVPPPRDDQARSVESVTADAATADAAPTTDRHPAVGASVEPDFGVDSPANVTRMKEDPSAERPRRRGARRMLAVALVAGGVLAAWIGIRAERGRAPDVARGGGRAAHMPACVAAERRNPPRRMARHGG